MSRYDWLLFIHVLGAFAFVGGAAVAAILNVAALRRERPSEVALLLRLTRFAVAAVGVGSITTLVIGLWLVHDAPFDYGYGDGWIVAALVLWVAAGALGGIGGRRDRETRELAERLAAAGDSASPELHARLHDPATLALSYGSGLLVLAILALMVWKP